MKKTYNTPKRKNVVKTRLDDAELFVLDWRAEQSGISRSEYLRRMIFGVFRPTIRVTCHDDATLAEIGKLTTAMDRIGNNMNQIARRLNTYDAPYPELSEEVKDAISDLTDLKFKVLKTTGDALGNVQTYFSVPLNITTFVVSS
jgi:hypothetical protein